MANFFYDFLPDFVTLHSHYSSGENGATAGSVSTRVGEHQRGRVHHLRRAGQAGPHQPHQGQESAGYCPGIYPLQGGPGQPLKGQESVEYCPGIYSL